MRNLTTFVLLGCTIALLGWILVFERNADSSVEAAIRKTRVVNFEKDGITGIVIERADDTIALAREDKDALWMMEQPISDRPDQEKVAQLLDLAADLKIIDTISPRELKEGEAAAEDLGFGDSKTVVSLRKGDEVAASFVVGDRTEIAEAIYVCTEIDWPKTPVHVAWGGILNILELPLNDLRDRNVLHANAEQFRRVKFKQGPASIVIESNREDVHWNLSKPLQTRADKAAVEDRIAALLAIPIDDFIDRPTPASEAAFEGELLEVRFLLHDIRGALGLDLADSEAAREGDFLYARASNRSGVFKVPRTILGHFTVNPNDVRDRAIAALDEDTVVEIEIQKFHADGEIPPPVRLKRYGDAWIVHRAGRDEPANSPKVAEFLKALNEPSVLEFTDDAVSALGDYNLDKPSMRIRFTSHLDQGEGAKPLAKIAELLIAGGGPGRYFAHFKDTPFVYQIDPDLYRRCVPYSISWRSPVIVRYHLFHLESLAITKPPSPSLELRYDVKTNQWDAVSEGVNLTGRLDKRKTQIVASTLSNLRADRWSASPGQGLQMIGSHTLLDIAIQLDDGSGKTIDPVRLRFAPTAPNVRGDLLFGRRNDEPDVFYVNRETVTTLATALIRKEADAAIVPPDD